jgi:hypothetical protein
MVASNNDRILILHGKEFACAGLLVCWSAVSRCHCKRGGSFFPWIS